MYEPRPYQHTTRNINMLERWFSMIGGGALTTLGLRRGGFSGLILSLVGGYLAQRGLTGHCAIYETIGMSTAATTDAPFNTNQDAPASKSKTEQQSSKTNSPRVGPTPGSAEGDRETVEADLRSKNLNA